MHVAWTWCCVSTLKKNAHLQGKVSLNLTWSPAPGHPSGSLAGREAGLTTSLRKLDESRSDAQPFHHAHGWCTGLDSWLFDELLYMRQQVGSGFKEGEPIADLRSPRISCAAPEGK